MDVPFISSGAISRAHYALVRKVETAQTIQLVDQLLMGEVHALRSQLALSTLTIKQCKECLILLLYCSMSMNAGVELDLDFAFHHAINLAETGISMQDKRIGYMFCAEMMPPNHELRLMLVNTLRKDLESFTVPRICLALDSLIQFSSEDVIPAVQSRLFDLLSHNSPHVRRRSLLAFRKLGAYNSGIFSQIVNKTQKHLTDPEPVVVSAALAVLGDLTSCQHISEDHLHTAVTALLKSMWNDRYQPQKKWLLVKGLDMLRTTAPSTDVMRLCMDIVQSSSHRGPSTYTELYQCFLLCSKATSYQVLLSAQEGSGTSFVQEIRHLLTTEDPNDLYLFIACLECLEPSVWAGTNAETPAVLQEWEVERVMKLLNSPDKAIRKKTLHVLKRIDQRIVEGYYVKALQGNSSGAQKDFEETSRRSLEIVEILCEDDGELYAHHVKDMIRMLEGDAPLDKRPILQEVMEGVLVKMRNGTATFRNGCIGTLFARVVDPDAELGPTLMVILAASISEYIYMSPMSPLELLRGLSLHLPQYSASIQDACLLSMIRVTADCGEVPFEVIEVINRVHDLGGRHIRTRCDQFLSLVKSRSKLKHIVSTARSSALPDFLFALETGEKETYEPTPHSPPLQPSRSISPSTSRGSPTPGKLRYAAYDPPKLVSRLRRPSSSSTSSRHSDDGASKFIGQGRSSMDSMSRTLTPGDLALAAGRPDLQAASTVSTQPAGAALPVLQVQDGDALATHVDLIALDSPFVAEPQASVSAASSVAELDLKNIWDTLEKHNNNMRGWCELPIDAVVRRLQGMQLHLRVKPADQAPFEGDLKVAISRQNVDVNSTSGLAILRLKDNEDDTCLWHLRCENAELRMAIKTLLAET